MFLRILMPPVLSAWAEGDPTALIDPSRCCSALKGCDPMRYATTLIAFTGTVLSEDATSDCLAPVQFYSPYSDPTRGQPVTS